MLRWRWAEEGAPCPGSLLPVLLQGRVCGLCGNFDGNALNDFTTRSQAVVGDALEFGNSWKLSPSCPDAPVPKDPCTTNPYRKAWAQKQCSIIHSATFATCHAHVWPARQGRGVSGLRRDHGQWSQEAEGTRGGGQHQLRAQRAGARGPMWTWHSGRAGALLLAAVA